MVLLMVIENLMEKGKEPGRCRDTPRACRFLGGKIDPSRQDSAHVRRYDPGPTLVPPPGRELGHIL